MHLFAIKFLFATMNVISIQTGGKAKLCLTLASK